VKRQDRQPAKPDKPSPSSGIFPKGKGISLSGKLLLLMAGLVAGFAIAEWATRIWLYSVADDYTYSLIALYEDVPQKHRMFSPHHYLNYCNTPDFVSRDGLNRHNSLGFRGEEIAIPKPAGRFRIAVLGGSGTYTIKVRDYRQSFPAQLERQLRETYGRTNVEVINAGVGGYNSWEILINLQFRVLDLQPTMSTRGSSHRRPTEATTPANGASGKRHSGRCGNAASCCACSTSGCGMSQCDMSAWRAM
jgi:hypothetical protein